MRKYDDNELKEVLEGLKSKAMKAKAEGMFAGLRMMRVQAMERRRYMFVMIESCQKREKEVAAGEYRDANPKLVDVKIRAARMEAKFAGEMLPLIDMEMMIIDKDFEEALKDIREADVLMAEEEAEYEGESSEAELRGAVAKDPQAELAGTMAGRVGRVKNLRDLN